MTAQNGYTHGIGPDILYSTNGGSDDWMYGEQATKPKIFSFTPEVGPEFWPPQSRIVPLAVENLRANLLLMNYVGLATLESAAETDPFADAFSAPDGSALGAASPNPFTRATTLTYALAAPGPVRLAVYDVLGREVALLVDAEREVGQHDVALDGARLPAGTYLVQLEAGGTVETRRVTLVR
jgi:hypothetical protein